MNAFNIQSLTNAAKWIFLFAIVVTTLIISRTQLIERGAIATAVVFDLTVSLPLAYLFFIRKTSVSKLTVIPVFIFGLFFASFIIPTENSVLHVLKMVVFPMLEIGVLGFAGYTIFKARKSYKSHKQRNFDVLENLRQTLAGEFPSPFLGRAIAFEIAVFYYAFLKWRGAKNGDENSYSYHRGKGIIALLAVFIFVILAETIVLHLLLANYSLILAWILTALSAYFIFQLFAHAKAVLFRPITLAADDVLVRCGIIGDARIAYQNIEKIETTFAAPAKEKDAIKISAAGKLSASNTKIVLRETEVFRGFYGIEKKIKTIFLAVDDAEKFRAAIENKLIEIK